MQTLAPLRQRNLALRRRLHFRFFAYCRANPLPCGPDAVGVAQEAGARIWRNAFPENKSIVRQHPFIPQIAISLTLPRSWILKFQQRNNRLVSFPFPYLPKLRSMGKAGHAMRSDGLTGISLGSSLCDSNDITLPRHPLNKGYRSIQSARRAIRSPRFDNQMSISIEQGHCTAVNLNDSTLGVAPSFTNSLRLSHFRKSVNN